MEDHIADFDLEAGFIIGDWTVLPSLNQIENETSTIHLEPKVMGGDKTEATPEDTTNLVS